MTASAALVLGALRLGQVFVDWLSLPFPGSAVGLLLLVAIFAILGGPDNGTVQLFDVAAPYPHCLRRLAASLPKHPATARASP